MRQRYEAQLLKLNEDLITLGALCEKIIKLAIEAFLTGDKTLIEQVRLIEAQIDDTEKTIEQECLSLLLMQSPVASDLRTISAALKMITDLERIGDQASDIAKLTKYTHGAKDDSNIKEMAERVISMVKNAVTSYIKRDLLLAHEVIAYDEIINNLFKAVKAETIESVKQGNKDGEEVLDVFMIAKYLERIGDHAKNVAEWVEYSITGEQIEHK